MAAQRLAAGQNRRCPATLKQPNIHRGAPIIPDKSGPFIFE